MGKFETKGQIASLFMGAAGVAILLILLVNAEARKRGLLLDDQVEEKVVLSENNDFKRSVSEENPGTLNRISNYVRSFYESHLKSHTRKKRSADGFEKMNDDTSITESILQEALSENKIRHIDDKVSYLGRDNYLVQSILRLYGQNSFYNTSDGSSDKNDEDIQDVQKYLDDSDITDKENKSIDEVDINSAGNTTEHKEIHLPLLEEDVFSDMHNALKAASHDCTANGGVFVIVAVTTFVNLIMFVLVMASTKLYTYYKKVNNPQDKIWLCQEDEISKYYEEDIEQKLGPIVIT